MTMTRTGTLLAFRGGRSATLVVAAFLSACGSSGDASDGGEGNGAACQFLATASSFTDYTSWTHYHLTDSIPLAPDGGTDLVHAAGPRDIYINLGQPGAPSC